MNFDHRYSDAIHNTRVAIIGPYPPPLGGISVHIKRVMHKLLQQGNIVFHFHNERPYKYAWFKKFPFRLISFVCYFSTFFAWLVYKRPAYVLYHTMYSRPAIVELGLLVCARFFIPCKIVVVEHNCRHIYTRGIRWKSWFNYFAKYVHVVLIGHVTYKTFCDHSIRLNSYSIESPFLPPDMSQEDSILQTYPKGLFTFLKNHTPIIGMNASRVSVWQGKDLYGFDQAIEMLRIMQHTNAQMGLVIVLAEIGDSHYFENIIQRIKHYQLDDKIFILTGNRHLWPLLRKVDLFIRPTRADTFGISVAESLLVGTPVIASDVCARPEGTVLYQQGNVHDLVKKIKVSLQEQGYGATDQQRDHLHTQQTG